MRAPHNVIPAKAGTSVCFTSKTGLPAFAGMTLQMA
jgi:hypothetical protein